MDLRPLLRPRHLTITVFVGLLAGATIAAATVGAEPEVPAILSAPVPIPAPREGDNGVYDFWSNGDAGLGADPGTWGEPDSTFRFTWGADALRFDGRGNQVWANILHLQHAYRDSADEVQQNWTFALRSGTALQFAHDGSFGSGWEQEGQGLTPASSSTSSSHQTVTWFDDDEVLWGGYPCLRLPFQGSLLPLGPHKVDVGQCGWFDHGSQVPPVHVEAVGGKPGERDVVLLSTTTDLGFPNVRTRMWLREGIPYPIRFEERGGQGQLQAVSVLREFEPGTTTLRGIEPTVSTLPPLEWAPRLRTGLDASGVDDAFPLATAFDAAQASANYTALRDFLADRPDAYVGWARSISYDTPQAIQRRWQFGVTEGHDVLGVDITRSWAKTFGPLTPLVPLAPAPRDTFEDEPSGAGYDYVPLLPQEVPATLPTVASLLREWSAYASPDMAALQANTYSFQLGRDPDGRGGSPGLFLRAGHEQYVASADAPAVLGQAVASNVTWTSSTVERRDDLAAVLGVFESTSTTRQQEVAVPAPGVTPSTQPDDAPKTAPVRVQARGLFELTPIEQAGIGIGALLVAGLYWIAPALKNGAVGLFSRIRDDDLLENPSRRLLRDLVAERPGIHHQDLVRRLGKGKGGAEHHLRKLVDGGILVARASPGYTCYWLPGQATKAAVAAAPALKSPIAQGIVRRRQQRPAISNAELARALGVRPATVHYHVERLRAAGVLTSSGHAMPGLVDGEDAATAA